jgi:hypothetical protein
MITLARRVFGAQITTAVDRADLEALLDIMADDSEAFDAMAALQRVAPLPALSPMVDLPRVLSDAIATAANAVAALQRVAQHAGPWASPEAEISELEVRGEVMTLMAHEMRKYLVCVMACAMPRPAWMTDELLFALAYGATLRALELVAGLPGADVDVAVVPLDRRLDVHEMMEQRRRARVAVSRLPSEKPSTPIRIG